MKSDIEQEYIADIIASRYPINEPVGIVEVGELTRDPAQFSATATKREDGVGFVEGAAPAPSSSSVAQVSQPRFGRGGVTAEQSAAAGGLEKPLTALADMGGGIARGITAQTMGLAGDIESLYNGLTSIFNRPEDQPRIDAFLQGLAQKTNMATTEQINKEGYRIPFTDINMPPLPPVVPAGSPDQKSREASANYGQAFGELAPIPSVVDVGVAGLKAGAKALAPNAASMMEQGLRKSGMITDIVPDGKSVAQQAAKSDIGFYSAVENAAINVQRKSGAGQSFLNDIMKGENVKAEEIKWMGLDEFLKGKKNVTKQEVQDYIANNKVDVQEVALGGKQKPFIDTENAIEYIAKEYNMTPSEVRAHWAYTDENDYVDLANQSIPNAKTRFDTYTLAGGENYREILLTMPNAKSKATATSNGNIWNVKFDNGQESTFSVNKANDVNEAINYAQQKLGILYKSSHFDQPNILAHLRVNDRVDADGKKMLLVEEVQSDWHQTGRNKGYKQNLSQDDVKNLLNNEGYDVNYNGINWVVNSKSGGAVPNKLVGNEANYQFAGDLNQVAAMVLGRQDLMPYTGLGIGAVPDAPFKDTWYQLALKRALQYAAENGYERVGLTTGKQQVDRFNLSKQLSRVSYQDGTLQGYDRSGALVMNKFVDPKDLPNYVGKELAQKMAENAKKDSEIRKKISSARYNKAPESEINALRSQLDETKTDYSGLDLEVGGEGMKKYYDEIYPKFLEKYGKKWNAKMGETKINPKEMAWKYGLDVKDINIPVRYIDITPEMKAGVQKGQPLFAAAPIGAATGTAAMQDERKK